MHSREQYLETLREDYRRASRKEKSRLLNEAWKRTRLARKVLIRKLAHPAKPSKPRPKRGASYGADVVTELVEVWELFDLYRSNSDADFASPLRRRCCALRSHRLIAR